jgi:PAS domain S-box-containing protein
MRTKNAVLGNGIRASDLTFSQLFQANTEEAQLTFNQRRAVIFDVEALGVLREQLINTVGEELAMGVLTRFGYSNGYSDAAMLKDSVSWATDMDWLAAGPTIHGLEGIVSALPQQIDFDRQTGHFDMHGIWVNSYEVEGHLLRYGHASHPVCWTLTGYASGYATRFFGRNLLAIETECVGKGDARCYWRIRPENEWGPEAAAYVKALKAVDVNRQLQQLQMEESRFRDVALSNADWVWETDADGRYTYCSEQVKRVMGYTPGEIVGRALSDFATPAERDRITAVFAQNSVNGLPITNLEHRILTRDGRAMTLLINGVPIKNDRGDVICYRGVAKDISARKCAERELEQHRAHLEELVAARTEELTIASRTFRALIDNIPDFMYVKDVKSRFVLANIHSARVMGAETPEELLGKTDFDFYPKEVARGFYEDEQEIMRIGKPLYNHEEKSLDSAGNEIHILTTKVPLYDSLGQVIGIAGVGHDITARKMMEDALREAERKYRGIFDNAIVGVFQTTPDGRVLSVNPAFASSLGYDSPEEAIARATDIERQFYVDPCGRYEFKRLMEKTGIVQNHEFEAYRKDGSKVWLAVSARAICQDGAVIRYEGMCEDISARKKIENELLEAEQKYRGIFDKAIIGIFQSTPHGRFLSVNRSMAFTCGYDSPEEMVASITDIVSQFFVDPKKGLEFMLIMDKIGGVKNFECETLCKDGSKIWLSMSIIAIRQKGVVVRYEGMCQDITERNLLQDQLLQAQKLESVGQLAAGIAHEINTPIQYIGDNVRFLRDAYQDIKILLADYERLLSAANDNTLFRETIQEVAAAIKEVDTGYLLEEIPKAIDQTLEGITRVAAIVGAMKEFSHPDMKEKILLDLNHAINSTITVARNEWKYVAEMKTEFDPSLPLISCLPGEFNQVILNLIVNAAHAIADVVKKGGSEKGTITVQTRNCTEWVEIRIQDTGTGIPKKVQPRIFDPFFTTKEIGKGTGQGLAIARSVIVVKHGGSIHFETVEGKGTTFIIRLPLNGKSLTARAVAA